MLLNSETNIGSAIFWAQRDIKWAFKTPDASHMRHVCERLIHTAKRELKALLKEQVVTDEVLSTAMEEVVTIIISRPVTCNSESVSDDEPIFPNHLLHLHPTPSLTPGVFVKGEHKRKDRYYGTETTLYITDGLFLLYTSNEFRYT